MMRVGLYRPVHVKTLRSQKLRMLLTHRKLLQSKRCGDEMMRVMLYEAAQSMLCSKKWSWLKAWAMQIARRRGVKKAIVALARRLAVIMHRIYGPAMRCKGIQTEWSFWSALIYPASRGS